MTSVKHTRPDSVPVTDEFIREQMKQLRWKTVDVAIPYETLKEYFTFLNNGVTVRAGREGVPFLTTTGIFGPIFPGDRTRLTPGQGTGVEVVGPYQGGETVIEQLDRFYRETVSIDETAATKVLAKWISVADGGAIPGLSSASNVFGGTGSLLVNQDVVEIPVLDVIDPRYHQTLAYYGGKLLHPGEEFAMGFDLPLFGMQYYGRLPDYISGFAMQPFGGGGLFVEHHPFPHIFLPKPDEGDEAFTVSKITLGRKIESAPEEQPAYHFTTFRVPSNGTALTIRPGTIHNDSYTNGPETVFLANTPANTVALRQTAPYTNIILNDVDDVPAQPPQHE
jgi:hypothetical protein